MCLILFAWQSHPRYSLVVAANRDEFHQRPSASACFWEDQPDILGGRDLQAGGTWLGVTRSGRFAAVTNYREPTGPAMPVDKSRGDLVRDYLESDGAPLEHARGLIADGISYGGYNLLLAVPESLVYVSNRGDHAATVTAGAHGLSNHLLDTDWPKVHSGRKRLQRLLNDERLDAEDLFGLLTDRSITPGEIPGGLERDLAPEELMKHYFIVSPVYGTRCSTVVLIRRDGNVQFRERQFNPAGQVVDEQSFHFSIEGATERS